ncbi:MAG TPA: hypothetical protein VFP98_10830 [Candidatus Polarisedimenticolia bacterium]|nr:hypothetical protein [Candidatus Polarisedimenticolia bacterium]
MRVEKFFTFGGGTKFGVLADVFNVLNVLNVFNKGEDIEVQERVGPTLGDASRLNLPRIRRLLIRYEW